MQAQARAVTRERQSVFDRLPAPGLVIIGIASVQVGAAFATKLFKDLGPGGTVFLRVLFAALFGLVLAFMNFTFYEALDRIHLGIAVTLEFIGPLGVALAGSRTRLDL